MRVQDDEGNWFGWTNPDTDVYVVRVNSLSPDQGTLIDDGDGNSDTNTYVASKAAQGVVVVTAGYYPTTGVTENDLPACWSLTGGNVQDDLHSHVDKTQVGCTTVTCTAGTFSKEVTIYVVEDDVWLPEPKPTYIQIIYDGDNVTDTEVKIFHDSFYSTWEDYGFTTTQLNDEDIKVVNGTPQTPVDDDSWQHDRKGELHGTPAQGSQTLTAIWEDDIYPPYSPPATDSTDDDEEKECTVILLPCPTGENTEKCDPDHVGTYAHFKGQLKPTDKDYSGFEVREFDGGTGKDTCWFPAAKILWDYDPWTEVTPKDNWTVGQNNYWETDNIGWHSETIINYRNAGRASCYSRAIQDMKVVDPSNSCGVYQTNTLEAHIGMTTLTSKRGPSGNLVIITWTW